MSKVFANIFYLTGKTFHNSYSNYHSTLYIIFLAGDDDRKLYGLYHTKTTVFLNCVLQNLLMKLSVITLAIIGLVIIIAFVAINYLPKPETETSGSNKISSPLGAELLVEKPSLLKGETTKLTLKAFVRDWALARDSNAKQTNVTMAFELPNNIELINNISGFVKESNTLKYSTKIGASGEQSYYLMFKALSAANTSIKYKFSFAIKNIDDVLENETLLIIKESKLVVNASTENTPIEAESSTTNLTQINSSKTMLPSISQSNSKSVSKIIILSVFALAVFLFITILINRVKKRKKAMPQEYHEAIRELQEKLPK